MGLTGCISWVDCQLLKLSPQSRGTEAVTGCVAEGPVGVGGLTGLAFCM